MIIQLVVLLIGLGIISYASERVVTCSTHIAHKFKLPPLIIGVLLISVGTDIPEIANSVFSSYSDYGDINVGNALGSCLTQITLVLGLVTLLGGTIKAHRKNILVLGGCVTLAALLASIVVLDGELTRIDAAILILSYIILLGISIKFTTGEYGKKEVDLSCSKHGTVVTFIRLVFGLVFVIIGSVIVVESAIELSNVIGLPEFFVSFFVIAIGTSLPELSVELAAIRKKNYGLAVGDLMGSNITDATLALGIGPLLFPTEINSGIIAPLAFYLIIASILVVSMFAWRKKIDKYAAILCIGIYLFSLVFAYH
ncbi:sodium:calcium antiporter [Candidatus Micrarchaeota archaeon]|nr:sodium:calcium antiporter [Candidatus Micrarchaeota archaeon]